MANLSSAEIKYKLSCDLAIYLTCIILSNIPKEDHELAIKKIMNNWSTRIEITREEIVKKLAIQMANEQSIETDVAKVIIDAHNVESQMTKGEFKTEIRDLMIKTIINQPTFKRISDENKIIE